jgi:hypothetical protein
VLCVDGSHGHALLNADATASPCCKEAEATPSSPVELPLLRSNPTEPPPRWWPALLRPRPPSPQCSPSSLVCVRCHLALFHSVRSCRTPTSPEDYSNHR